VEIFLKKPGGGYGVISYDTMLSDIRDLDDVDGDGKREVVILDMYGGKKHNYFSYSIYKIRGFKLANADGDITPFPKFIWFTDKPNDKDTVHLTGKERAQHVIKKNEAIEYRDI